MSLKAAPQQIMVLGQSQLKLSTALGRKKSAQPVVAEQTLSKAKSSACLGSGTKLHLSAKHKYNNYVNNQTIKPGQLKIRRTSHDKTSDKKPTVKSGQRAQTPDLQLKSDFQGSKKANITSLLDGIADDKVKLLQTQRIFKNGGAQTAMGTRGFLGGTPQRKVSGQHFQISQS